jgi:hypothetical protein
VANPELEYTAVLATLDFVHPGTGQTGCLYVAYLTVDYATKNIPTVAQEHLGLFLLLILVITLGTLIWLFIGAWKYAVYFGTLNINAQQVLDGERLDFEMAYKTITPEKRMPYKLLLMLAYMLLPILSLGNMVLFCILGAFALSVGNTLMYLGALLIGFLLSILILLAWLLLLIPLSLVVQIAVLENHAFNPIIIFKRSAQLVFKRFWATLSLQVILFAATNYLVPLPLAFLFRALHLSAPLDHVHQWIIGLVFSGITEGSVSEPQAAEAFSLLKNMMPHMAQGWTDLTVMLIITALMLPWGTFAFTLLYRDTVQRTQASGNAW